MKSNYPIRIAIADDHPYIREGLKGLLSANPNFQTVAEAANGQELIEKIGALPGPPDICLLDVQMPVLDGYDTLAIIRKYWPSVKVIILSVFDHEFTITEMLRRGANGFLNKGNDTAELYPAIEAVHREGYYHSPDLNFQFSLFITSSSKLKLTAKEKEFLVHCCSDRSYNEIASQMNISPYTADGYRSTLFRKLNVQTRVGLALFAVHAGLH